MIKSDIKMTLLKMQKELMKQVVDIEKQKASGTYKSKAERERETKEQEIKQIVILPPPQIKQ